MKKGLREQIIARAQGQCEWPKCWTAGAELAHHHSRGMGGNRETRDVAENISWLCEMHARFSDGETAGYGMGAYRLAHLDLLGPRFLELPAHLIAWERAEALTRLVK